MNTILESPAATLDSLPASMLCPAVVSSGSGRFADLGDHRGHLVISSAQSGGAFSLFDVSVDAGGGPPPHIHTREDETFHIQSGRFEGFLGDQLFEAGPGDAIFAPRGVPHAWRCVSEDGGQMLLLVTPGENFERFAIEMSERALLKLPLPEMIAALNELGARHGIQMLPPPGVA
jgi:quercetin dioxygenase-like cupin family protein